MRNNFWYLPIIFFVGYFSCHLKDQPDSGMKSIKFKNVTIGIPRGYRYVKGRGIDSYVAYIVSDKNDTFSLEYGRPGIINSLFEDPPVAYLITDKSKIESGFGKTDSSQVVYTYTPKDDNLEGAFLKNYYRYDTIHGIVVKIVQP